MSQRLSQHHRTEARGVQKVRAVCMCMDDHGHANQRYSFEGRGRGEGRGALHYLEALS